MRTHTSFRGVALIVLGITAIAFPAVASFAAAYIVGWVLIVAGFTRLFLGWRAESDDESTIWAGFISLAYVVAGVAILANPLWAITTTAVVLGATLAVQGILSVLVYFTAEHASRWVLVNGLVTVALAIVIVGGWLGYSVWIIWTLVGVNLFMAGVFELAAWSERVRADQFRVS
jgi:uncharacterized membrane protein HdeD (DUF308 family)